MLVFRSVSNTSWSGGITTLSLEKMRQLLSATRLLSLALPCVLAGSAQAQTIRGTVVNQTTDEPIPFASVALVTQAGAVSKMTITNSEGAYSLTAREPGICLTLSASSAGRS